MTDPDVMSAPPRGLGAGPAVPAGSTRRPAWDFGTGKMPSAFDQIGPGARSVAVPGVLLLVLVSVGLAAMAVGAAGVIRSLADADVFEFEAAQVNIPRAECATERRQARAAVLAYVADQGRPPATMSDLVPGYLDEAPGAFQLTVADGEAQVVARDDGRCGAFVSQGDSGVDDEQRARDAVDAFAAAPANGLLFGGGLALGAAAGFQGWWLASTYRCLPRKRQHRAPRRAYGPFVVYVVGLTAVASVQTAFVSSEVSYDEPIMTGSTLVLLQFTFLFALVFALLKAVEMLGDVTFHFCDGHYLTSRLMRLSIKGFFLLPAAGLVIGLGVGAAGFGEVGVAVMLVGWLLGSVICPLVFIISYVIAVMMAIFGVERALRAAAAELTSHAAGAVGA